MARTYALLCWALGILLLGVGLWFLWTFLLYLAPGGTGGLPFPVGPNGYYFVAFSGSALVAWGGCLIGAARGSGGRPVGTATAFGLTLGALYRILVWVTGDAAWAGEAPRVEAALFLVLALAFLWLRPARAASEAA